MSTLVTAEHGFVWCPCCEKVAERKGETEPLPLCHDCREWMEPLLCDEMGCEEEATVQVGELFCCEEHA